MKNVKKVLSLFLSIVMLLSLSAPAFAQETENVTGSAVVLFEDGADADRLCAELEALPGIRVRWRYNALLRGAAIEGSRAALSLAGKTAGVSALAPGRMWTQAETITKPVEPSNSLDLINGLDVRYDGDGIVVAVLDSGLRIDHEAFQDYGIMEHAALSEEDVQAFTAAGGTDGRYISAKIPFAYDYNGNDRSVHTQDTHGTHVSALAVGYVPNGDGGAKFRGAAPAAQLLSMKVFPDNADLGADDVDILKAMEDAYLLGADVINLSLGMTHGFYGDSRIGLVYRQMIDMLEAAGVVVCCAAGNDATALTGKIGDAALPGGAYTDYGTVGAPAIYDGAAAIAAVNSAFYEAGGGIMTEDRTILFTKMVPEIEDALLPEIETLAGQTMDYVVIDGLGSKEDFAGLDLTGCAALVKRGELYFSEKVQNAAAAGAVFCMIYNNEPGVILAAVKDTTIPCVMLSQKDGEYLIEQAEEGRGTITIAPERMKISTGNEVTVFSHSSWGAAGLKIVPTLSAPGGLVLSASVSANNAYEYLSGTSMASPNAAGAYAVLLEALRERGIEDKKERAELAADLLESTASWVRNENGTPLSPRRQGAGLIDLTAALESDAVLVEPLLELGESENGRFTLHLTVKNLSEKDLSFTWKATVLTDAYEENEGSWRSLLSPLNITEHVDISGIPRFTVGAKEERTISLTLRVDAELRAELGQVYPNGFYTEGYLTLISSENEMLHATFLGYCGDWEQAPIIEPVDFRDVMDAYFEQEAGDEDALSAMKVEMGYNLVLLCDESMDTYGALLPGENPRRVTRHSDARIAMSTASGNGFLSHGDRFLIELYTLRNAEHVIMAIVDQQTGEIYHVTDMAYLLRSEVSETLNTPLPAARFMWDGTNAFGEILPSGTAVNVLFYAWMESEEVSRSYRFHMTEAGDQNSYRWLLEGQYNDYIEWEFPLILDAEAPEINCRINAGDETVEIQVSDEHFLAYMFVQDRENNTLAEETCADEQAGKTHELRIPVDACEGQMLYVTVADYAGNTVGYEIALGETSEDGTLRAVRCPTAMLTDVEKNAWYHEAVDFVIENGLMDTSDGMVFSPNSGVGRVQVLEMLYDLAGCPVVEDAVLPFEDVRGVEDFIPALYWAYCEGIVTGYSESFFGAHAPLQRAQLAVMLYRAAQSSGEDTAYTAGDFADADAVPEWAVDALGWAAEMGYLTADENGMILPSANVTRAEFAVLMMKFYQNTSDKERTEWN